MSKPVHADKCIPEILDLYEELKAYRHDIHAHPDCGLETQRTVSKIQEILSKHGIPDKDMDAKSVPGSLLVLIEGNKAGKTIALRADIDALKMSDKGGKEYSSVIEGQAHACGHDGHQTWLIGAAIYLAAHRDFAGRILCIFQGGEEISKGADSVVNAGILEKYDIKEIYAAHDDPTLPKGTIGFKVGHIQAASDSFEIKLTGKGTHGGRPHQGLDPMPAAAELYLAIQSIVSRKIDPLESGVVSVCFLQAGRVGTFNVLPAEACMGGTVRTYLPEVRDMVEDSIKRLAHGIGEGHGLTVEVMYDRQIDSVNNDEELTKIAIGKATDMIGAENIVPDMRAFMTSEDFSVYQRHIPGTICRIGIKDENHQVPLHNPAFDFNDEVLPMASTLFVNLALSRLAE